MSAEAEAFCYSNDNSKPECDVLVKAEVGPLGHAIIKVSFGSDKSIEVAPFGFTKINGKNLSEVYLKNLSISNSALSLWVHSFPGNSTIRFEQRSTDVARSLYDFDIRYY